MGPRFLTPRQVCERFGFSKSHLYRLLREERFPKQVQIGTLRVAFVAEEVDAWATKLIAARDAGEIREGQKHAARATEASKRKAVR